MRTVTLQRFILFLLLLAMAFGVLSACGNPKLRERLQKAQQHRLDGETALKAKDYAQAETEFKAAIALSPQPVADLYNSLGVAQTNQKKYDAAAANLEKAIVMEKSNFRYHMNLGTTYFYQKKKAAALKQWEIAMELAPGNKDLKAAYERVKYHDN